MKERLKVPYHVAFYVGGTYIDLKTMLKAEQAHIPELSLAELFWALERPRVLTNCPWSLVLLRSAIVKLRRSRAHDDHYDLLAELARRFYPATEIEQATIFNFDFGRPFEARNPHRRTGSRGGIRGAPLPCMQTFV